MTLTELKYIVAVARERHFGKAAEACFVSQPTLSVAVKKLEEELEIKLFERSVNEVTVTPLGEEVVQQAQSVLGQAANRSDHDDDRHAAFGEASPDVRAIVRKVGQVAGRFDRDLHIATTRQTRRGCMKAHHRVVSRVVFRC